MDIRDLYRDPSPAVHPGAESMRIMGRRGAILSLLYTPGTSPAPAVLLSHGFPGSEQNMDLAQALRRMGFAVMTYHYSGSWGSDGDFSFRNCLEDAETILETLKQHSAVDASCIYAVGHSMGGFITAHLLARHPELRAGVLICPWDVARSYALPEAHEKLKYVLDCGYGWLRGVSETTFHAELAQDTDSLRLDKLAPQLVGKPVYCIGASEDEDTPLEFNQRPLRDAMLAAGADDRFRYEELPGDHSFNSGRIMLLDTICRYLAEREN